MKYILKRSEGGVYYRNCSQDGYKDNTLSLLSVLLADSTNRDAAKDAIKGYSATGNCIHAYHEDENIILYNIYDGTDDDNFEIAIDKEKLKNLINEWEKLAKEKADRIIIAKDGDNYSISGKFIININAIE